MGPVKIEDGDIRFRALLEAAEIRPAQGISAADGRRVVVILGADGRGRPPITRVRIIPTCMFMIMSGGAVSVPSPIFRPMSR